MRVALVEARRAGDRGEIPVGAVVAVDGRVVARAGNASVGRHDPTGHAEIRALRRAARRLGSYRLTEGTVWVTLEPCFICMGAMFHARFSRLVFGQVAPQRGEAVLCYA